MSPLRKGQIFITILQMYFYLKKSKVIFMENEYHAQEAYLFLWGQKFIFKNRVDAKLLVYKQMRN